MSNPLPHIIISPQVVHTSAAWRPPYSRFKIYTSTDMRRALLAGWAAARCGKPKPIVRYPQLPPTEEREIRLAYKQLTPTFTVSGAYVQLHGHPFARVRSLPGARDWLVLRKHKMFSQSQRSVLRHLPRFRNNYLAAPGANLNARPKTLLQYNFGLLEQIILKAHRARTDNSQKNHLVDATLLWNRLNSFSKDSTLPMPEFSSDVSKAWVAMKIADKLTSTNSTPSEWTLPY